MNTQGKPSTKAKNKYRDKTYDRMELILPKGKKEQLRNHILKQGKSLNGFVNEAIEEKMERDNTVI